MKTFFRHIYRLVDFIIASCIFFIFLILLLSRRLFGKYKIEHPKNRIVAISRDGVNQIIRCNGANFFDEDFTRPHADITYVLFIGNEKPAIFKPGKKVIGINIRMPFEKLKTLFPFTIRTMQQAAGFFITVNMLQRISPKAIEVFFPAKLALRAILLKWTLPIKLVTQVRGNLDLIYYFNPFPAFFPFQMTLGLFEICQLMWDKLISLLFYRSCDVVIGYNINNMLSAISNGAHPAKTKLVRIKIEYSMLKTALLPRATLTEISPEGKIISLWSRLSPEKLVLESVQAFEKLAAVAQEKLCLVIIGDGPEKNCIASYVANSVYKNQIYMLGLRNREFIAQIALHSSMSLVPYGGSSLVEAVLLGVPVVAFDIEWHNELIRDGETGYLADFPDTQHMAEKMLEILTHPAEAKRRADAAKEVALKMFDEATSNAKEARYYAPLFDQSS